MIYAAYNIPVSVKHPVLTEHVGFEIKKMFLELKVTIDVYRRSEYTKDIK